MRVWLSDWYDWHISYSAVLKAENGSVKCVCVYVCMSLFCSFLFLWLNYIKWMYNEKLMSFHHVPSPKPPDRFQWHWVLVVQSQSYQANFYSVHILQSLICPIPMCVLNTLYQSCCHIITVLGLPCLFLLTITTLYLSSRAVCILNIKI